MVICLERGADLHTAQPMPLPLTVSCFGKIQIGFTILVSAHPGSPGQRVVKRVCVFNGLLLSIVQRPYYCANFLLLTCCVDFMTEIWISDVTFMKG